MMQGYVSASAVPPSERPLRYRVKRREGGWAVVINACATRPLASRASAEPLACTLQAEADGLRHQARRPS